MVNGQLSTYVPGCNVPGWSVVGVGDINRDGYDDIVIQNQSTDQIDYCNMAGGAFNGFVNVGTTPGYNVVAVEDINVYICPEGKLLTTTGRVHDDRTILYRASTRDCVSCLLKPKCTPNVTFRKIPCDVHDVADPDHIPARHVGEDGIAT